MSSVLRFKEGVENEIIMNSWNGLHKSPIIIFRINYMHLFSFITISVKKVGFENNKVRFFDEFGDFFSNCLFPKEFLKCIDLFIAVTKTK